MKRIIEIVPKLIALTKSGDIHWEYMEDAPCLKGSFNNDNLMICKAENEKNENIISLNYIDDKEMIVGEFMKWKEKDAQYNLLNELYAFAEQKKVLLAC
jgi:hypothetical protein